MNAIHIAEQLKIRELQAGFREQYPYLEPEFYKYPHRTEAASPDRNRKMIFAGAPECLCR